MTDGPVYHCMGDEFFLERGSNIVVLPCVHDGHYGPHSHTFCEFVYIERGFTLHSYNEVTTVLTPGDLFAIKPGDIHAYSSAYHTHLYNCLFTPEALGAVMQDLVKLPGLSNLLMAEQPSTWIRIHLDIQARDEAQLYLGSMQQECINRPLGWELHLRSLLTSFLILFARTYNEIHEPSKNEGAGQFRSVARALSFLDQHFSEDICISDVADATGLSPDYLSRQFKQMTGLAPVEYLKNIRFAKAVELLRNPVIPVADIATAVGFDDPSYFTKAFRALLGTSPSEYRRMSNWSHR